MTSRSPRAALMISGLAALILTGCREEASVRPREPLFVPADGAAAYLPPLAPAWQDLPPAPPAPLRRAAYAPDYGYAERAYAIDQAFYDAPPDYGVYGMEGEPWAWRSDDGYQMFAEPIDAGYRYYYYEPGHDYPFFVRTPDYGYGYGAGGLLLAIYAASGDLLPYDQAYVLAPRAGRYWGRGRTLYSSARIRPEPVVYETWLARRPVLTASREPWMRAAIVEPQWRGYRERHASRELRHFARERDRRVEQVDRLERREIRQALRREQPVRVAAVERHAGGERPFDRRDRGRVQRDENAAQRFQNDRRSDQVRGEREALRHEQQAQRGRQQADAQRRERAERGGERRREQAQRQEVEQRQAQGQARRAQARAERPAREPRPERVAEAHGAQRRAEQAVRDMRPPPQRVERPERLARAESPRAERQQQAQARGQARAEARDVRNSARDGAAHDRGGRADRPRKD